MMRMARDWPVLEGALAAARRPDELEKPDPGFRRGSAGSSFNVSCCWGGPGFACFKVSFWWGRSCCAAGNSSQGFRRCYSFSSPLSGGPDGALYTVPSRRSKNIRSLFWSNTTPPISSMLWSSGTTLRPSLSSCSAALFPSPSGGFGWKGGEAISHPTPSSRRGRLIPNKRLPPSSSERSIIRSKRGRFSIPHGSPSRSADCIPAWRSSEPWDQAKPQLA